MNKPTVKNEKTITRIIIFGLLILVLNHPLVTDSKLQAASAIDDTTQQKLEQLTGEPRVEEMLAQARKAVRKDPELSRQILLEAISYSQEINFELGVVRASNGLGVVLQLMGEYSQGLEYFQQALVGFQDLGNMEGQATTLQNISAVQLSLDMPEEALATSKSALAIRQELGDEEALGKSLMSIGVINRDLGKLTEALDYSQRYLDLMRKFDNRAGVVKALTTIGTIQSEMGLETESMASCEEAVHLARTLDDPYGLGVALANLSDIYLNLNKFDEAIKASSESLLLGEEMKTKALMKSSHHVLAQAYEGKNQPTPALKHYHQYKALKNELFSEETSLRISELTARFEVARVRNRLLELERDRVSNELVLEVERRQRDIFLVGFSISLPLAVLAFFLFRRARTTSKQLARKAEELETALGNLRTLRGLIPICASCKNVRDDQGYWHQVEAYVMEHSHAEFSHGICPQCARALYGEDLIKKD